MARGAVALLLALAAPGALASSPLYKLVDRDGRVTYTDSPPKSFAGQVIRLEPDTAPTAQVPRAAPASPPTAAAPDSFSERRRREQAELLARLEKARRDADAARRAKEEGAAVRPDELQVIQRRYPVPRAGQPAPFPNCARRTDPGNASPVLVCPTQVPGPAYYERQRVLDASVVDAEALLAGAEAAVRRGLD